MARYRRIKLWRKFYKQKQMCIFNRIAIRRTLNMPSKIANYSMMVTFKTTIIKLHPGLLFPVKTSFQIQINDKKLRKKKKHLLWFQNRSTMAVPLCSHFVSFLKETFALSIASPQSAQWLWGILLTQHFFPKVKFRELLHQQNNARIYALNLSNMLT